MAAEPFLGTVRLFPYGFAPKYWKLCDGSAQSIALNTALYSLLGTYYGGNGQTTFALPNLLGAVAVGAGQGSGLSNYNLGTTVGVPTVALDTTQLPAHNHPIACQTAQGDSGSPAEHFPAASQSSGFPSVAKDNLYTTGTPNESMNAQAVSSKGGSQPHNNMQPYTAMAYYICTQGVFPTRM